MGPMKHCADYENIIGFFPKIAYNFYTIACYFTIDEKKMKLIVYALDDEGLIFLTSALREP